MTTMCSRTIFDWRFREQCFKDLRSYAGDVFNDELIRELERIGLDACWSDDLSWLPIDDIDKLVLGRFAGFYKSIKGFHGCRPINVAQYLDVGLHGQKQSVIEAIFRRIFSDLDESLIAQAIEEMDERGRGEKGKSYFVSDPNELITMSGHYLIQGSEYLMSLAARLCDFDDDREEDYTLRLRRVGVPTIFEVDIPIARIPTKQLTSIAAVVVAEWCNFNLFPGEGYNKILCYIAHGDIPGACISGHSHPTEISDPHNGRRIYRVESPTCEVCEGIQLSHSVQPPA